jgi:hypothetical protein
MIERNLLRLMRMDTQRRISKSPNLIELNRVRTERRSKKKY